MGAALLAGLGVGVWSGLDQVEACWQQDRLFQVRMEASERQSRMRTWHQAVARARTPAL
jgi:glycerol kinase